MTLSSIQKDALPPIFFDHIPKTAGTSVERILATFYGREAIVRMDGRTDVCLREGRNIKVLTGHVAHIPGCAPFESRYTFTLLRNPISRALSVYYYFCKQGHFGLSGPVDGGPRDVTLEEFVEGKVAGGDSVSNFQVRHLAAMQVGGAGDDPLEAAKATLRGYHLFGLQEQFDEFVALLLRDLGLPEVSSHPRENVSAIYRGAKEFPASTRRLIERRNELDVALWNWARQEFDVRRHAPPARIVFVGAALASATFDQPRAQRVAVNAPGVQVVGVGVEAIDGRQPPFVCGETIRFRIVLWSENRDLDVTVGFGLATVLRQEVFATNTHHLGRGIHLEAGKASEIRFEFPALLAPGHYLASLSCHQGPNTNSGAVYVWNETAAEFDMVNTLLPPFGGLVFLPVSSGHGEWSASATSE